MADHLEGMTALAGSDRVTKRDRLTFHLGPRADPLVARIRAQATVSPMERLSGLEEVVDTVKRARTATAMGHGEPHRGPRSIRRVQRW